MVTITAFLFPVLMCLPCPSPAPGTHGYLWVRLHNIQMKPDSGSQSKIAFVGARKVKGDFSSLFLLTIDICYFHLGYSEQHVLLWVGKGAAVRHLSPWVLTEGSSWEKWVQKCIFKSLEYINCFIRSARSIFLCLYRNVFYRRTKLLLAWCHTYFYFKRKGLVTLNKA